MVPFEESLVSFKSFFKNHITFYHTQNKIILDNPLTLINCLRTKQLKKQFEQKLTD